MSTPVDIPESDADLLAQCDLESFRAGGPGGQHVNTTDSAVRLRHRPTGITVSARDERSQHRNKALCLARLRERLAALNRRKPKRIPTRKPKSAQRRIMDAKTRRGRLKSLRGRPGPED